MACTSLVHAATETRNLKEFTSLVITRAYNVTYVASDEYSVTIISGRTECLKCTETAVNSKGELHIIRSGKFEPTENVNSEKEAVNIIVKAPFLNSITCSGTVTFSTNSELKADTFTLNMSGSSEANIASISCNKFIVNANGASDVIVRKSLNATTGNINISGSADIILNQVVEAETFNAQLSGSSDLKIAHIEANTVNAQTSGSSDIIFVGNINSLNRTSTGGSSIEYIKR